MSFQKMMLDRIDYIPLSYFEGMELVSELGLTDQVTILPNPLTSSPLHIAFSRKSSCVGLVPDVNSIIQALKADGTIDRLIHEYIKVKK